MTITNTAPAAMTPAAINAAIEHAVLCAANTVRVMRVVNHPAAPRIAAAMVGATPDVIDADTALWVGSIADAVADGIDADPTPAMMEVHAYCTELAIAMRVVAAV